MPDIKALPVFWTENSLMNTISIKKYLSENFSQKEINSFLALLLSFEEAVAIFPELYPVSGKKRKIRRAVLGNVMSAFYTIHSDKIEVLAVLDNRRDLSKWL